MNASRTQHLVPAVAVLALAIVVFYLSYTREPADAFLFPRLVAVAMVLFASWNMLRALLGLAKVGSGVSGKQLLRLIPGIVIMAATVFYLAKTLGFYTAGFLAFTSIYSFYDANSHKKLSSWLMRVGVAFVFMLIIYGLFSMILKVQTPRGLFI